MASCLLGQPPNSGGQPIFSGYFWSGRALPVGWVQIRLDKTASGDAYFYWSGAYVHPASGGPQIASGGFFLSGGLGISGLGLMDGFVLHPGDGFFVPRSAFRIDNSGGMGGLCMLHTPAVSGQGRVWFIEL